MNLRDVWTLYSSEVRAALRERTLVVNTILVPVLLYPAMIFGAVTVFTFVSAQTETFVSRVELRELPWSHEALLDRLQDEERMELLDREGEVDEAEARVRSGEIDAVLTFLPPPEEADVEGNFRARITHNGARDRSVAAQTRLTALIEEYRSDWLDEEARKLGVSDVDWMVFRVEQKNLSTGEQMGAYLLSMLIPLMLSIMVAVGCFYPAIDATAGERERNTWETTMTMATSRLNIVVAKYLYVVTFGCLAGFLNVIALLVTMRGLLNSLLGDTGDLTVNVPWHAIPVIAMAAFLLASLLGAAMMIFASFAKTFKEGQAMVTPLYLLSVLPMLPLQDSGLELTAGRAMVPILDIALVIRDAFRSQFDWAMIALTLATCLTVIAATLWLAHRILQFEDVVTGSYQGRFLDLVRHRLLGRKEQDRS